MATRRILIVCTANVCRSPVVEHLFQRALDAHGVAADVTSAGTHGGRNVVHRNTIAAASEIGIDLTEHRSRYLDDDRIERDGANLIVTMTREHLARVVELVPGAFTRTFTLPELAELTRVHDVDPTTRTLDEWVAAIGEYRVLDATLDGPDTFDVSDPYGGPKILHQRMVRQVVELVDSVVPTLAASIDPD